MSNFGSSRSEESCSAVVELLERVTRLHKQLELKESQAEMDVDQVQTTSACSLYTELNHKPFCGCVFHVKLDYRGLGRLL